MPRKNRNKNKHPTGNQYHAKGTPPGAALTKKQLRNRVRNQARKAKKATIQVPGALQGVVDAKSFARDVRTQGDSSNTIPLANQEKAVIVVCNITSAAIYGVFQSYVSIALQKGFAAVASTPETPFFALTYGWTVLFAYANRQTPTVPTLPYWLLCLGHAISPKTVPFGLGSISYSWEFDQTTQPTGTSQIPIGLTSYGFIYNLNVPDTTADVDGFPISDQVSAPYSDAAGAQAFQELTQYVEGLGLNNKASKLVPLSMKTPFVNNVSMFAQNSLACGLGSGGLGGFVAQLQLEVPIFNPIFGVFCPTTSNPDAAQNRFYCRTEDGSGDSFVLGGMVSNLVPEAQWSMRRYPKFHAIDFLQFGDVLSQWVAGAQQLAINDPQVQLVTAVEDGRAVKAKLSTSQMLQCPLTLQEVLLLFRNVCMQNFKETQPLVQSLYPRLPASDTADEFVPFVCCATTCALSGSNMQLPTGIIENLRALVNRMRQFSNGPADVQHWIPVLGQYFAESLNSNDYYYADPIDGTITPSFATSSSFFYETIDPKSGKRVDVPQVEVPISLIDGSATQNGGTVYVQINDTQALRNLESIWNTWIKDAYIGTYSMTMGVQSTELGISCLTSIGMTRHWIPLLDDFKGHERHQPKKVLKDRRERVKKSSVSPYTNKQTVADTSQSLILSAPYESVLNTWVLPVNKALAGGNIGRETSFQRYQLFNCEPFSSVTSAGEVGADVDNQNTTYAMKMLKSRNIVTSDFEQTLNDAAAKGRGGILSGLISAFAPAVSSLLGDIGM